MIIALRYKNENNFRLGLLFLFFFSVFFFGGAISFDLNKI